MRIISKYKDYYDGVVGTTGIDNTIVYERFPDGIERQNDFPKPFNSQRGYDNPFTSIYFSTDPKNKYDKCIFFIVGFCGKLYLGWRFFYDVKVFDPEYDRMVEESRYDVVYGYENAKKFLREDKNISNHNRIEQILAYNPIDIFREVKAPVFVYNQSRESLSDHFGGDKLFVINPILKELKFYKVFDTFSAFQEIQMFISGVLGVGEREMIEVADKYKIGQHGFDKHSFRKEPGQKKSRK